MLVITALLQWRERNLRPLRPARRHALGRTRRRVARVSRPTRPRPGYSSSTMGLSRCRPGVPCRDNADLPATRLELSTENLGRWSGVAPTGHRHLRRRPARRQPWNCPGTGSAHPAPTVVARLLTTRAHDAARHHLPAARRQLILLAPSSPWFPSRRCATSLPALVTGPLQPHLIVPEPVRCSQQLVGQARPTARFPAPSARPSQINPSRPPHRRHQGGGLWLFSPAALIIIRP